MQLQVKQVSLCDLSYTYRQIAINLAVSINDWL